MVWKTGWTGLARLPTSLAVIATKSSIDEISVASLRSHGSGEMRRHDGDTHSMAQWAEKGGQLFLRQIVFDRDVRPTEENGRHPMSRTRR